MNIIDTQISRSNSVRDDFYGIVCVATLALASVFAVVPPQGEPAARAPAPSAATATESPALPSFDEPPASAFAEITPAETVGAYEG
jgi:hypothetical protein